MKITPLLYAGILAAPLALTNVSCAHTSDPTSTNPGVAPATPSQSAVAAYVLRMDGTSDAALALLEKTLVADDTDAGIHFELARTSFYHFDFDSAAASIDRAIALDPDNPRLHFFAGQNAGYRAITKYKNADTRSECEPLMGVSLRALAQAVELDPDHHEARIMLINMLIQAPPSQGGDKDAAKQHAKILADKDPVYGLAAKTMVHDGLSNDAVIGLWKNIIAQHPDRGDAHGELAKAYLENDDLDLAAMHINQAIALDPTQREMLLTLCREQAGGGDPSGAKKSAEQYLALTPTPPAPMRAFATFYLATIEKRNGDRDTAEAVLAEAKAIDPHVWTTFMPPPASLFEAP